MTQTSKIPAAISQNDSWRSLVVRADDWVREVLGEWAESKTWEWDVKTDPAGHPQFDFRLVFGESVVAERFDRFEVANKRVLSKRIVAAWGVVLDDALDRRLRRNAEMARRWSEEGVAVAN